MKRFYRLLAFTRWFNRNGGNSAPSDLEKAFIAGWNAANRHRRS